jgi:RNA polymerase sigma-70 factor (ECF subfamily)
MTATVEQTTLTPVRTAADHVRFEALWRRHHTSVRCWLTGAVRDRQVAEDLAAEVFLRAWRYLHRLRSTEDDPVGVRHWLFTIARNVLTDHRRSAYTRRVEPVDELSEPGCEPSAEDTVVAADQSARLSEAVRDAIEALPDPQRTVLLGDLAGHSVREIAAAMGRTPASVHVLRWRGRGFVGRWAVWPEMPRRRSTTGAESSPAAEGVAC